MEKTLILSFTLAIIFLGVISALPAPPIPHAFYGEIKYSNGEFVNTGVIIAKINGTTIDSNEIINGKYGYGGAFVVEALGPKIIEFYFEENLIGTYIFEPFEITHLDFNLTYNKPSYNNSVKKIHCQNHFAQFCDVNWKCSGWSECSNGIMTRKCVDTNNCEIEYNKPYETSGCNGDALSKVYIEAENLNSLWIIIGIILFVVLLVILVNLFK